MSSNEIWKTERVNFNLLAATLNRLVNEGWHIWPQCIYYDAPNHFIIIVNKTKVEDESK